ncbi:LysR family transcriptional regulator [Clostridium botulinum D/C]|uniref:LysR family transcriptional regulator n=1 Tax=Clostridium botulinum TaxID=1491 RepID=UPI001E31199E|nr:LysR family transcriptional regulator [Clostridium botulinum]MCD3351422.1 LysR family transcriptional regulator [Clostridium botulinum D/C]MCD3360378.1 LysR family transcriptional regulator [Clostridium botulinum D/C]MCD3362796.1 LysR family transcriptional regulator [Clostridium botulinum D/C]MCD3366183.1 LysR family transcriptional regulator [Clostridium botulinum D/C]
MLNNKLITFLTLAKVRNYTKTAEILNLTQPAVSQHIKFLEEYYGMKFIKKQGKNSLLTEEGEEFLEYVREAELRERILREKLKNKFFLEKKYNIGATLTIGGYVLPKVLGKYKECHPNTDIILNVFNTDAILEKILKDEFELGVIEGPFDKNKFKYIKLKNDELVLAVAKGHPFSNMEYVNLEDVMNGKLILREEGSGTRKYFEREVKKQGYDSRNLNVYMEVGSIDAIKALVEANLGYTIISKEAIKRECSLGVIKIVNIKNNNLKQVNFYREFNFVYRAEMLSDYLKNFIQFCLKNS